MFRFQTKSGLAAATILLLFSCFTLSGCVYFNTFYNAKKSFKTAEKSRTSQNDPKAKGNRQEYQKAIEKALKVVENHPNSKWYDDALYVLGISYYYTDQYSKSERRMREILANYPNSKYVSEARLYSAKAKLMQKDYDDAMGLFETIFQEARDKKEKAEAATALGYYYFENKRYQESQPYLLAIRDSLGDEKQRIIAQQSIADAYFETFAYANALSAYLQMLGMKPDTWQKYHALSHAATSAYRLQRIEDGIDYLTTLANDELYFDSLGSIKLRLAEGYLQDENLPGAELVYQDIITNEKSNQVVGEAFYQLGLIAQFEEDNLALARRQYDTAATLLGRGSNEISQDALQRANDIGKLDEYRKKFVFDSTTTIEKIDEAAMTHILLADLYSQKLNKPDSAMTELKYLIDSLPTSTYVPEAMITLSILYREYNVDTVGADSILREVLAKYPNADEASRAIALLGLIGTPADTGYAKYYIDRAEKFLVDEKNVDSARVYYQEVVKRYPKSKYFDQANFALIWLTEEYASPGDSSLIFAYEDFIDSFPTSLYVNEARRKLTPPTAIKNKPKQDDHPSTEGDSTDLPFGGLDSLGDSLADASDTAVDITRGHAGIYIGPDGDSLELLKGVNPEEIKDTFAFPEAARGYADPEYQLYFQIKLDFSGKVEQYVLKNPTDIPELNEEAERAVKSMTFKTIDIPDRLRNKWVVYRYIIRRPDYLR